MPYYNTDFEPWSRGIRNMGSLMMQMPAMKAQAQRTRMQGEALQQRAGADAAQAQKYEAETQAMAEKGRLYGVLEQSAPQAITDFQSGNLESPALQQMVGAMSSLSGEDPDTIVQSFGQMASQFIARGGDTPMAAAVNDPNAAHKVNTEAQRPISLPNNQQLVTPIGQTLNPGQHELGMGEVLFGSGHDLGNRTMHPMAEGNPTPPKSSAVDAERARLAGRLIGGDGLSEYAGTNAPAGMAAFDQAVGSGNAGSDLDRTDVTAVRDEAIQAIRNGKDPEAVRQRFFQMTGQQLDF